MDRESSVGVRETVGRQNEEILLKAKNGMGMLILNVVLMVAAAIGLFAGIFGCAVSGSAFSVLLIIISGLYLCLIGPILFAGLKILKPNEAYVFTLFGKYHGTIKGEGFYFVNPFVSAVSPTSEESTGLEMLLTQSNKGKGQTSVPKRSKKISLKAMTLSNDKQKINDEMGNPIEIGIVVVWKVVNTAKALFNVDHYQEYLSLQCDSALRNIVRMYPYDVADGTDERSLRGSSQEVSEKLKTAIQEKVDIAGLKILEARITHLAYAPEIAAAMLQRQQAAAIIDARKMIVDGAVGMVSMALEKLSSDEIVELDEERKAAMVSNLLVVLCGNKDAQPVVNSGSIY